MRIQQLRSLKQRIYDNGGVYLYRAYTNHKGNESSEMEFVLFQGGILILHTNHYGCSVYTETRMDLENLRLYFPGLKEVNLTNLSDVASKHGTYMFNASSNHKSSAISLRFYAMQTSTVAVSWTEEECRCIVYVKMQGSFEFVCESLGLEVEGETQSAGENSGD